MKSLTTQCRNLYTASKANKQKGSTLYAPFAFRTNTNSNH